MSSGPQRRYVSGTIGWCHICGLPIPNDIASRYHPLYGTVDHVIPKALGGQNILENRRAAHYLCNRLKADRPLELIDGIAFMNRIQTLMNQSGRVCSRAMLSRARRHIAERPSSIYILRSQRQHYSIQVWESDGGACSTVIDEVNK